MVEFTLLEVHLDDAAFTANAPFSGGSDEDGESDQRDRTRPGSTGTDGDGGAIGKLGLLAPLAFGVLVLAAVALAVRRLLGGESEPIEDLDVLSEQDPASAAE